MKSKVNVITEDKFVVVRHIVIHFAKAAVILSSLSATGTCVRIEGFHS